MVRLLVAVPGEGARVARPGQGPAPAASQLPGGVDAGAADVSAADVCAVLAPEVCELV